MAKKKKEKKSRLKNTKFVEHCNLPSCNAAHDHNGIEHSLIYETSIYLQVLNMPLLIRKLPPSEYSWNHPKL